MLLEHQALWEATEMQLVLRLICCVLTAIYYLMSFVKRKMEKIRVDCEKLTDALSSRTGDRACTQGCLC